MRAKGFTLIELLVVIAIIGILSSVVLASLNSARQRGDNARRLSDMRQIQSALELYASANGGNYPNTGHARPCVPSSWTPLESALLPYLPAIPKDPAQDCGTADRQYYVITSASDYKILIHNPPSPTTAARSVWDPTRDNGASTSVVDGSGPWAWAAYTQGGVTW